MQNRVTLGIDIGGTNTDFAFIDIDGNCICTSTIRTISQNNATDFFARLHLEIENLYKNIPGDFRIKGIGVGPPNGNFYRGTVENPHNLNWRVVNVVDILRQYYEVPVATTNDANASAIGEMLFGVAKGMKDFIIITLGTGLGSGIAVNGELVYSSDGFAKKISHTIYNPNGRQCGCGRKRCLETYVSSTGIKLTVIELLANSSEYSNLRKISYHALESKMIYASARAGDKIAKAAFDFTGNALGSKLADAVAVTSPEAIILSGGLAFAGNLIIEPTKKSMEENLFHVFQNKVQIIPSGLLEKK